MPRPPRTALGGFIYHVLNRANDRKRIFETEGDYRAFAAILSDVQARVDMRILAWCLMPNHWHLVLWPRQDGDLSNFVRLATVTHTQRWHARRASAGTGHLYQGRFKSFPVQDDAHLMTVCRYVEANALRANLVGRAEEWRWSSLGQPLRSPLAYAVPRIAEWPLPRPADWIEQVNEPASKPELERLRSSVQRGTPYGPLPWVHEVADRFGLSSTLRARGRPIEQKGS